MLYRGFINIPLIKIKKIIIKKSLDSLSKDFFWGFSIFMFKKKLLYKTSFTLFFPIAQAVF